MTDTITAERYYPTFDRGADDMAAHSAAVKQVLRDIGVDADNVDRLAIAVLATDSFPSTGATPHFARALDDIYDLRRAAAYEARVLEAHYEGMKSFPKSRLPLAEESVARLRNLARGGYAQEQQAVGTLPAPDGYFRLNRMKQSFKALGLEEGMTNWAYEQERPLLVEDTITRHRRIQDLLLDEGVAPKVASRAAEGIVALPESQPSGAYSEAVTEVYALRGWFAIEAAVIQDHLALKSFPKSRRSYAEEQYDRFALLAAGKRVHHGVNSRSLDGALHQAGADPTLSRTEWEAGVAAGAWGWMPAA